MTALIDFEDAVTAGNLDPNATHAVYYMDGRFQNEAAVRARCPHAKLYGITVFGATGKGIFACDSETGDLNVPQTIAWVAAQVKLGVELVVVYANLNRWVNEGLLSALAPYGGRIKRWVAHYDNVRNNMEPWADADQYADPGPIDKNVALANFFDGVTPVPVPPKPKPKPPLVKATKEASVEVQVNVGEHPRGVLRALLTYDSAKGNWTVHRLPGVVHLDGGSGKWRAEGIPFDAGPLGHHK